MIARLHSASLPLVAILMEPNSRSEQLSVDVKIRFSDKSAEREFQIDPIPVCRAFQHTDQANNR